LKRSDDFINFVTGYSDTENVYVKEKHAVCLFVSLFCLVLRRNNTLVSYGAETGKIILATLGCYKLKATPRVKTISPA
jgi:hypothetical protein